LFPKIGIKKEFTIIPWDDPESCTKGYPEYIRNGYLESSPSIEKSYNFENREQEVRLLYRERARARSRARASDRVCARLCVREREIDRERERQTERQRQRQAKRKREIARVCERASERASER